MKNRVIVKASFSVFQEVLNRLLGHSPCRALLVEHLQVNSGITKLVVG